jgi:tripartite-type tricarboxylate transporter receptor subunit TctC
MERRKKMSQWMKRGVVLGALFFFAAGVSSAWAQAHFPDRPIQVIIPFGAGGGADVGFTAFKEHVAKILGQPIISEFKPGAAGAIGAAFVAKAKPDGYTLLLGNKGGLIMAPLTRKDVGYTLDDFTPVCNLFRSPNFWFVREDTPYKTLKEWNLAAKTKKMKYATYGALSLSHIVQEYMAKMEGYQAIHIPYGGAPQALAAALGGHVDMASCASAPGMVGPGKLRVIATSSEKRFELYPEAPTLLEMGYTIFKGDPVGASFWLWAPKGTPKEIVDKIAGAFKRVVDERGKEISKTLMMAEYYVEFMGPEELGKRAREEVLLEKRMLENMGVTPK